MSQRDKLKNNESIFNRAHGFLTRKIKSNNEFNVTDVNKNYLYDFPEPKNNIERSFYQYKCQRKIMGGFKAFIYDLLSFPVLCVILLKFKFSKINNGVSKSKKVAVIYDEIKADLIPNELHDDFDEIIIADQQGKLYDKGSYRFFIENVQKKYPCSFYFLLKNLVKMSQYGALVSEYKASAILTCNEYSFTSSFLTEYCNYLGVEHIDIMHGEKLFSIRDTFFNFSKCYVWDDFYIKLFEKLRTNKDQFIVVTPPSLKFKASDVEKKYDYTYYLQDESNDELFKISELLTKLKSKGFKVCYRPHPIFENKSTCGILNGIDRENPSEVRIEQSILQTKNVVSKYSTVLYQAYLNGVNVVIDDVTNKELYNSLISAEYIMLDKEHTKLSELLNAVGE